MKRYVRKFVGALVALLIILFVAWYLFGAIMTSSYGRLHWGSSEPTAERTSAVLIGGIGVHGGKNYYYRPGIARLLRQWGFYLIPVSFALSLYYSYLRLQARTEAMEKELDRCETDERPASATPNGGPATPSDNSGASGGPSSVS